MAHLPQILTIYWPFRNQSAGVLWAPQCLFRFIRLPVFYHPRPVYRAPNKPLEDRLNEFILAAFTKAYDELQWEAQREESERNRAIEAKRLAEIARRREEELARVRQFEQQALKWQQSQSLLAFVAAVREAHGGGGIRDEALDVWLVWAETHAFNLNPIPGMLQQMSVSEARKTQS